MIGSRTFLQKLLSLVLAGALTVTSIEIADRHRGLPLQSIDPLGSEVLAEPPLSSTNGATTGLPSNGGWNRRKLSLFSALVGIGLFLGASPWIKAWANDYTQGALPKTYVVMAVISVICKMGASVFSQVFEFEGGDGRAFRLHGEKMLRQILVALLFSVLIEGTYYEIGLPAIPIEQGIAWFFSNPHFHGFLTWLLPDAFRTVLIDQPVSLFFLDPVNLYLNQWWVEKQKHKEAVAAIRQNAIPFYRLTAPLWMGVIFVANLFSRPFVNFMIVNVGMILWEFLVSVASSPHGSDHLIEIRSWIASQFPWRFRLTTPRLLSRFIDGWLAAGHHFYNKPWFGRYIIGMLALGYAVFLGLAVGYATYSNATFPQRSA